MKRFLYLILFVAINATAQVPEDALRTSSFSLFGSARNMATAGTVSTLGGEITSAHTNPAGIGFYKNSELVISSGLLLNHNQANYRGIDSISNKNAFNYGTCGIVLGGVFQDGNQALKSGAISFSVNQLANYNNHIQYSGFNNYSSFSEQYLEELVKDHADTNAALSNYIFGSSLAYRTYLIDTTKDASGMVNGYKSLVPLGTGVNQYYDAITRGGYHELAFTAATNLNDKWYLGASLTIPIISYTRTINYSESDATNDTTNHFASFKYQEHFQSKGGGWGLKFGVIYRPAPSWRLGLAFHTPQFIAMTDELRVSMTTNTEKYAGIKSESSDNLNDANPASRNYVITTPYRVIANVGYVIGEVFPTQKQRAFINASIEYINYRGARYGIKSTDNDESLKTYYKALNDVIKDYYKGNVNFRLGGEIKFDPFAFRIGAAYLNTPYKEQQPSSVNQFVATTGLGYRNHGLFIDIAFAKTYIKNVDFPYRLSDKANTYATINGQQTNIMLTFGIKL